jgi:hypothetical protein
MVFKSMLVIMDLPPGIGWGLCRVSSAWCFSTYWTLAAFFFRKRRGTRASSLEIFVTAAWSQTLSFSDSKLCSGLKSCGTPQLWYMERWGGGRLRSSFRKPWVSRSRMEPGRKGMFRYMVPPSASASSMRR